MGVADAGYHPVVVTQVQRRKVVLQERVFFHDPDPQRGGENQALKRDTFAQSWSVWGTWLYVGGYLTLKMPEASPRERLPPWVFLEAWSPQHRD